MRLLTFLIVLACASPLAAHEFWIAPEKYVIDPKGELRADFINGQEFKGSPLAWFANRFDLAEAHVGSVRDQIDGRLGDLPAITYAPKAEGLLALIAETRPSKLTYSEPSKFANFVRHKRFDVDPDTQNYPFTEVYTRHVKALVQVGTVSMQDRAFGMETEFVALENPYLDNTTDGLDVQILYQGTPRPMAQIEVFEMSEVGDVRIFTLESDGNGQAAIPVKAGHRYLLDAVVLRPPSKATLSRLGNANGVLWETLWAALTFAVPQ